MKTAILFLVLAGLGVQEPAGAIAGLVRDPAGAAVVGAHVRAVSTATGLARESVISDQGNYSFPSLPAGEYEVIVDASGFQTMVRAAVVETGGTTTTDFSLRVGDVSQSITVDGASPQMHYESNTVGGSITRSQIESFPLNGRSFLELAKLETGVQAPSRATSNRMFLPVLGAPGGNNGRGTRVTIDGGSIMAIGNGGSAMGLSQESVQEFQISILNFDLSTGATFAGAANVVTRSGSNQVHGNALYFFGDHMLAAYPALKRDPANLDPFFQRRQFGFSVGGPLRRDRMFLFANWERNEQRGVATATLLDSDFARFSRITPSPFYGNQASVRFDARLSNTHTGFIRYSHDGNRAFAPPDKQSNAYPSTWTRQSAWADQSILGLTSVFRPSLVNDLRFSYFFVSSNQTPPGDEDCRGCLGVNAPAINIQQTMSIGEATTVLSLGRRFHFNDLVTWQLGTHRMRFGADWEYNRGGTLTWSNEPATITLYSPDDARQSGIPTPAEFRTLDDVLQLPLRNLTVAVGDPRVPQSNGSLVRRWTTARVFFQDTWRIGPRLSINSGLGWSIDRNLNYDLTKPVLLAPILGDNGLGPTQKEWKNFSPVVGLAWMPSADGKSVVRAGAGIYYDFLFPPGLDAERAALGPPGLGRQTFQGTSIPNMLPGIPGVPVGLALDFRRRPTLLTGANLISILPAIRAALLQDLANADRSVQQIQVTKTQAGNVLNPMEVPTSSALHFNAGIQRQLAKNFVVGADFAYRRFVHLGLGAGGVDMNHFNSIRGPVIPACTNAQRSDATAVCSNGPINVWQSPGRATYKGLLVRAEQRFSRNFQFLGSYAYSRNTGTNTGNGFNLDNWLENQGPLATDVTHVLNLAGITRLPRGIEMGLNFSFSSAPPFTAYVGGADFNGDGTTGDLLPGSSVNAFNRTMRRPDLVRLVGRFNQTYAGKTDGQGVPIPALALPGHYWFGDSVQALDVRFSRSFALRESSRLTIIGEAFNVYNAANLLGHSGDLTNAAFGQPTSRFSQVFGSGGPRAFQLALKIGF